LVIASEINWGVKCTKFYSDSFRFDIFIVQCVGGLLFSRHSVLSVLYFTVGLGRTDNKAPG